MYATLVIAVGPFGRDVAERLRSEGDERAVRFVGFPLPGTVPGRSWAEVIAGFRARVGADLRSLLHSEAAASAGDRTRLDVVVVADLAEVGGDSLAEAVASVASVIDGDFSVMFPPRAESAQRAAHVVVVAAAPALDRSAGGRAALASLAMLERAHCEDLRASLLSRIYVLPRQNEKMPLSDEDVLRGVYLFVSTAYRSGIRDLDVIQSRLAPPRDPRAVLGTFAVAAADVDTFALGEAFRWRSALAGLDVLAAQCDRGAANVASEAGAELDLDVWWRAEAGVVERGRVGVPGDSLALDRAEAAAVGAARTALYGFVDRQLGQHERGLSDFGAVVAGLRRARDRLEVAAVDPQRAWLATAAPPAAAPAEAAASSDAAMARREPPSAWWLAQAGALLALAAGAGAASLASVALVRLAAGAGPRSGFKVSAAGVAGIGADRWTLVMWGGAIAILVAVAWTVAWRVIARRARAARAAAGGASPDDVADEARRQAERGLMAAVQMRRRRVARDIVAIVNDELERLDALRASIHDAATRARERLKHLGVQPATQPANDSYARLFEAETPLHCALVPPAAIPKLWEQTREVRDDEVWAARMLSAAYRPGGHREDLPFAPGESWEGALDEQHRTLREKSVFAWPDLGGHLRAELGRFFGTAAAALAFGVRPVREDGTPMPLSDARELLIVASPEGRPLVAGALADRALPESVVLAGGQRARVVVLKTGADIDTAAIVRSFA